MYKNKTSIRVRYCETDQMGVVHHSNYAHFFEIGRTEWLRALGLSYKKLEENDIMLPVISLSCHFKKSAFYDEIITINTHLKKEPTVKIEFDYTILNEKNEILCTGNTTLAFINALTMKPIRCPESIINKLIKITT